MLMRKNLETKICLYFYIKTQKWYLISLDAWWNPRTKVYQYLVENEEICSCRSSYTLSEWPRTLPIIYYTTIELIEK